MSVTNGKHPQPPLSGKEIAQLRLGTERLQHLHESKVGSVSGVSLRLAPNVQFFSPDGLRTIHRDFITSSDRDRVGRDTAFALAAYMYVAIRYRMQKISEAPLMVVQEDQKDGSFEWLPDYPLARVLSDPSPDFDMSELMALTEAYTCITGMALWKKDLTRGGMIGRLTPYNGHEFSMEQKDDRIYGKFIVETSQGPDILGPDDVVLFRSLDPFSWHTGISIVDVALSWLNLGQQARASTYDILRNALFPSVIVLADPSWDPQPDEYEKWQQDLESYADRDKRGAPLGLLGGGNAVKVGLTMRDLIPGDILDRVESVVAAVAGVPAVVLQYQIGMENAPWSQMAEARRMAYEDTIEPAWRSYENKLTRQLLWAPPSTGSKMPLEADRGKLIRFDTSSIRALQADRLGGALIAERVRDDSSQNERRMLAGLEPSSDPDADKIPKPQLNAPADLPLSGVTDTAVAVDAEHSLAGSSVTAALEVITRLGSGAISPIASVELLVALGISREAAERMAATQPEVLDPALPALPDEEILDEFVNPFAEDASRLGKRLFKGRRMEWSRKEIWRHFDVQVKSALERWEGVIANDLKNQMEDVINVLLGAQKDIKKIDPASFQLELDLLIRRRIVPRMRAVTYPLMIATGGAGVRAAASQVGVSFRVLQPGLLQFAAEEASFLAGVMGETTGRAVAAAVTEGLGQGETTRQLRARLEQLPEFDRQRAKLVARTETTRAWNGAQRRSLTEYQRVSQKTVVKSWLSAGDSFVREEHADLEQETADNPIPVDQEFSNGLLNPGEPNCRCTTTYQILEA